MIAGFDASKERNRLADFAEARKRALAAREERKKSPAAATPTNPVTTALNSIEQSIKAKAWAKARGDLKALLVANPSDPRIYYNLGRVASLEAADEQDPEAESRLLLEARVAYGNVLRVATASTPKDLLSLTYVKLGDLYVHFGETDYAIKLYDAAIKLNDVPNGAYREAIAAKQRLLKTPQ
jgi:tetratricopeptide (TPR) repeat protein